MGREGGGVENKENKDENATKLVAPLTLSPQGVQSRDNKHFNNVPKVVLLKLNVYGADT